MRVRHQTLFAIVAILLFAMAVYPATSRAADALTIDEAVRIALDEHPALAIAAANERIAFTRVREARAAWLPAVEVSETYARGNNPVFVFGSLLEQGRFGPSNFDPHFLNNPPSLQNYRSALSIRYPLFDQWRRVDAARQASLGVSIAEAQTSAARQSRTFEVLRAFYGAILAAEEKHAAEEAVRSAEADTKRIQNRVDAGLLVLSDLLAAKVQLAAFQQRDIAAAGELAIARRALAITIGRPHERFEPAGALPTLDVPLGDLGALLASGTQSRSDVRAAALEARIAASQSHTANGALLPRLDAFASWGASGQSFSEHNSDHTVGVVASWRFPNPAASGERARAVEAMKAAAARNEETASAAELEIVTSWEHARAAEGRRTIAAATIAQAEEALRIVHDRYEQGLTPITEVLRAQSSLVEAKVLHFRALYDHTIAYAQLLRATGALDSVQHFQQTNDSAGVRP